MITIRNKQDSDEAFIYSTWLRGLYFGNEWFRKINKPDFFEKYRLVISHLLSSSEVQVACLAEDPEIIVGYSVYTTNKVILHWVYVKKSWRGQGIGKSLIPAEIKKVSHLTEKASKPSKERGWVFDPLIV